MTDRWKLYKKSIGPATATFIQRSLEEKRHFASRLKSVQLLRRDAYKDGFAERIESACAHALKLNCISFDRLRSIIRTNADNRLSPASTVPVADHSNLRGAEYYSNVQESGA